MINRSFRSNRSVRKAVLFLCLLVPVSLAACLRPASFSEGDVVVELSTIGGTPEPLRCGYYAGWQMIRHYDPGKPASEFVEGALGGVRAESTLGVLDLVRANIDATVSLSRSSRIEIASHLRGGHPVVVFLPAGGIEFFSMRAVGVSMLHAIVLVGYDSRSTSVFYYSEAKGPFRMSASRFEKNWDASGNLALYVDE